MNSGLTLTRPNLELLTKNHQNQQVCYGWAGTGTHLTMLETASYACILVLPVTR